ncbi:MAG: pyrroline-5-carboxylate reductase [Verrucomicrobiae bacterium]|nr:pyrroline-5-carboxylate reductase [Verrucomicrobiae bacterium]NNJ43828.1 pyrroline-5-carboxylate reductase [Akkermansiaceae bacterium]
MEIGLIGCGRMGGALIAGIVKSDVTTPSQVWAFDPYPESLAALVEKLNIQPASDNKELTKQSQTILLAVKPQYITTVLADISPALTSKHLLISVAAGVTLGTMEAACPEGTRIIRAMPNTPALIGLGATGIAAGSHASSSDIDLAKKLLESAGISCETTEPQLDAVTGLSGSGPAYVYTFIESLAAQAEKEGLPAKDALELAIQTVIGGAQMVQQTGMTPRELVNQVTSPGGTTLAGLAALTEHGFESSIAAGVHAAAERSREIAKES